MTELSEQASRETQSETAPDRIKAKQLPRTIWILAYLISPAATFICLRIERAVSTLECILGVIITLVVHIGLISVLGNTNRDPLQLFIELLLGASLYLIVMWQYLAGHQCSLWSKEAERQWRIAGRFFGAILFIGVAFAILGFHLRRLFPTAFH